MQFSVMWWKESFHIASKGMQIGRIKSFLRKKGSSNGVLYLEFKCDTDKELFVSWDCNLKPLNFRQNQSIGQHIWRQVN